MVSLESLVNWLVCGVNIQGPSLHQNVKETAMLAAHWQTMTPNVFQSLVGIAALYGTTGKQKEAEFLVRVLVFGLQSLSAILREVKKLETKKRTPGPTGSKWFVYLFTALPTPTAFVVLTILLTSPCSGLGT